MNRLKMQKFKVNSDMENNSEKNTKLSNNKDVSTSSGLFNKLTKRYSTLSSKITRRPQPGRKSKSPQRAISGSYDMTGAHSDDHRLEIGAPILISTTTIDTDRFGVTEARLKQIGGGIAVANSVLLTVDNCNSINKPGLTTNQTNEEATQVFQQIPSSSSENELYSDAISGSPIINKPILTDEEEKYDSAIESTKPISEKSDEPVSNPASNTSSVSIRKSEARSVTEDANTSAKESSPEIVNTSIQSGQISLKSNEVTPLNALYDLAKPKQRLVKKQHSKSAYNLHRTELRMYLAKAPSVALDMNLTTADLNNCHDLPRLPELYDQKLEINSSADSDADKENSSPSVILKSKSEPNTPMTPEQRISGYMSLEQQSSPHFKSIDSLDIHRNIVKRRNCGLNISNNSIEQSDGSKQSLNSHNSTLDDFNLKSVSCQSLNAQSLFVSIDELNEITRQINEAEEFNQEIDLEYCLHRDNLKPSERRITLLKNKNGRIMNLVHNKEKLKKGWHGVKHWLGEEGHKIKEVVQKQSTLQRVASSRLNLNLGHAECRSSPSVHGSMSLKTMDSQKTLADSKSSGTIMARSVDVLDTSCDNITEYENEDDDLDCSLRASAGEDTSPATKRARREVRVY